MAVDLRGGSPDSGIGISDHSRPMAAVILTPTFSPTARWNADFLVHHPIYGARPSLRGRFHQLGAIVAIPTGIWLLASASSSGDYAAALVYATTSVMMFTTSAAYHRLAQTVQARFWMRRLDHSMIFVHMAGATTPLALICIGGTVGLMLVAMSWLLTAVGVGLKMTRLTADHDPCGWLFPILGALSMVALPALFTGQQHSAGFLLIVAGVLYAAGATCFVRKAPNPRPSVFGYHEIWHVFTLAAGACEFFVMVQVIGA